MLDDPPPSATNEPGAETTLGGRIQQARAARSLSVSQLAQRAGVTPETVRNWESDRSEPRINKLQMLAGMLGVPPLWLLGGETVADEADYSVNLDDTAGLARKVERLMTMQQSMATLLFEVDAEVRRLQSDIDDAAIKM